MEVPHYCLSGKSERPGKSPKRQGRPFNHLVPTFAGPHAISLPAFIVFFACNVFLPSPLTTSANRLTEGL